MDAAETFLIMDLQSSNALAFFGTKQAGQEAFAAMLADQPERADDIALVALDEQGFTIASLTAAEFRAAS